MRRILTIGLVLIPALPFLSCGERLPSPRSAERIITRHFHSYGKKFKESDFGKHKLERVEVREIREMQKGMAEVESYLTLKEGPVYWVRVSLRKKTLGWKYLAWETLGAR